VAKKTKNDRASRPDEDNPEWTKEDFARARPAAEVLPEFIGEKAAQELMRRGRGRPQKADKKVNQTLRLDPDVLEAFRQEGSGWQGASIRCCGRTCHDARGESSALLPKRRRFRGNAPEGALASLPPPATPPINRLNVLTRPAPRLPASVRYSAAIWIICCDAVRRAKSKILTETVLLAAGSPRN
jgi:uncharacterized protein (DUF4415 family)